MKRSTVAIRDDLKLVHMSSTVDPSFLLSVISSVSWLSSELRSSHRSRVGVLLSWLLLGALGFYIKVGDYDAVVRYAWH